jgi:Domain of unknown function (DUF6542)
MYDVRDTFSPPASPPAQERSGLSLTGVGAVAVLCGISFVAGLVDVLAGDALRLVFSGGLVLGAVVAALLVVRRDLLVVVFAPPLVYVAASALAVLLGRGDSGGGLIDAAAGWLVYGFPAMAAATGAAAVIAAIRHTRAR